MPHLPHIIKGKQRERRGFERQTGLGLYANSHHGSKGGSQAESKRGWKVDLNGCGIQAIKSTVIKTRHSFLTNLAS